MCVLCCQVIPKTAEEMSALKDSLMKNVLFKYMDEKTREDIFDVIQPKDYQPAQDVIVQGQHSLTTFISSDLLSCLLLLFKLYLKRKNQAQKFKEKNLKMYNKTI